MKKTKQAVVKIHGDRDFVVRLLNIVELRTKGISSKVMRSGTYGDWHAFMTVFEVVE